MAAQQDADAGKLGALTSDKTDSYVASLDLADLVKLIDTAVTTWTTTRWLLTGTRSLRGPRALTTKAKLLIAATRGGPPAVPGVATRFNYLDKLPVGVGPGRKVAQVQVAMGNKPIRVNKGKT